MKKLIYLTLMLALAGSLLANEAKVGSTGAQFLRIGVGSKYQGMADAAVAAANDVYAMYWNPAGLVEVENWAVGFTNVNYLLDIDLNYVGVARHFEDIGTLGASVSVLSADGQEITTAEAEDQNGTGSNYTFTSYAIGLSYARQLTNRFAFGGTFKFIGEEIGLVDAQGVAFDFGTMLYTGFRSLRLGMSISNMGRDMKFTGNGLQVPYQGPDTGSGDNPADAEISSTPYSLPLVFRVGLAYDWEPAPKSLVTFSGELKHPNDNDRQGALGAEYAFNQQFFLRGGYKFNYDEESLALGGGLKAGLGNDTHLVIDYAWQDFGRLETTQRFSVGFVF